MSRNENYKKSCLIFDFNTLFVKSDLEIFSCSFLCYKNAKFSCSPASILPILNPAKIFGILSSHKKLLICVSGAAFNILDNTLHVTWIINYTQGHQIREIYRGI